MKSQPQPHRGASSHGFLDHALALAKKGFLVFPAYPGAKNPAGGKNWQERATSDPLALCELWAANPDCNPAIFTRGHVVIDADLYKEGVRLEDFTSMGPLPDTFTVRTASGGTHFYFKADEDFTNSAGGLPRGFDVRGRGGLVLGPGAIFEGNEYKIIKDVPPAPLPEWLALTLRRAAARVVDAGTTIGELDTPETLDRCRAWIQVAPEVFEGSRDDTAIKVAYKFYDYGVSLSTCLDLLHEWNDEKVRPPLDAEDLERLAASGITSRRDAIGRDNARAGFEPIVHPPVSPKRSKLIYADEISLEAMRQRRESALVEDLCHRGELGVIYADSTAGKSFLALDMSFAVALGKTWHGRRVARGPVLYVCLEGAGGFQQRVLACYRQHGDPGRRFAMLPISVSIKRGREGDAGLQEILGFAREFEAAAGEPVAVIVIDTLQRAMGGDNENDTSDMSHFVERLGRIQNATGAAVIVCHHCNASGNIRGSTALFASADFVLRIDRDKQRRKVRAEKVKDGRDGPMFNFELADIDIGTDGAGQHYKSAVVTRIASGDVGVPTDKSKPEPKSHRCFRDAARACVEANPGLAERGFATIPAADLESAFRKLYPTGESDPQKRNATLSRYWRDLNKKTPADFDVQKIAGVDYFIWASKTDFNEDDGFRISRISADKSEKSARSHRERIADSADAPFNRAPNPIRPRPNTFNEGEIAPAA